MLKHRLISATFLISILSVALFYSGTVGAVVFTIVGAVVLARGLKEFFTMLEKVGYRGFPTLTCAVGALMFLSVAVPSLLMNNAKSYAELEILIIIFFVIIGFIRVFKSENHKDGLLQHLVSIGGLIYVCWTLNFIAKIYFIEGVEMSGRYLVLFLVAVTKSSDIGAYFTGTTTAKLLKGGNHKIAPRLSPGKSWEGFWGGCALSVIVAIVLVATLGDKLYIMNQSGVSQQVITYTWAVIIGVTFGTLGFLGDIAESVLKRSSGMKDSGSILPGMGGIMDVVDSLTLVAPLFYCFIQISLK